MPSTMNKIQKYMKEQEERRKEKRTQALDELLRQTIYDDVDAGTYQQRERKTARDLADEWKRGE